MTSPSEGQISRPISDPTQGTPSRCLGPAAMPGDTGSIAAVCRVDASAVWRAEIRADAEHPTMHGAVPHPRVTWPHGAIVPRPRNPETRPPTDRAL